MPAPTTARSCKPDATVLSSEIATCNYGGRHGGIVERWRVDAPTDTLQPWMPALRALCVASITTAAMGLGALIVPEAFVSGANTWECETETIMLVAQGPAPPRTPTPTPTQCQPTPTPTRFPPPPVRTPAQTPIPPTASPTATVPPATESPSPTATSLAVPSASGPQHPGGAFPIGAVTFAIAILAIGAGGSALALHSMLRAGQRR